MELVARLDNYGRPAWLAVMILGFIVFWPIGLMVLGYLIWSGRMGCWKHGGAGRWHFYGADQGRSRGGKRSHGGRHGGRHAQAASGNTAFDEYRDETLRRLEHERAEFEGYLERLRHAKDKAEFDAFMDEQRRRSEEPEGSDIPPGPDAPDDPEPRPGA